MFADKIIVIPGGTGSFGRRVLKYVLDTDVREIRIFSRDEKKQEEVRHEFGDGRLRSYLGDVRNYESVENAFRHADFVFHAAALKQVPSCEFYPMEAIRTNVIGADNVVRAATKQQVKRVIMLSTDKAVYPINAMGQTKALMEKVTLAQARMLNGETTLCVTRYGNVMASRGSVIPLFVDQVKRGKPLTITDPTMTRFLMSLDESVRLVFHTFEHGRQGDIFVQKSPAATILDLATERSYSNRLYRAKKWRESRRLKGTIASRQTTAISITRCILRKASVKSASLQTTRPTTRLGSMYHRLRNCSWA
jgi:UDP-N-acetylglucosamine 4,6-dehydratase/5-epimerase